MSDERHLLYVWAPAGYTLEEREGAPPAAGSVVDVGGSSQLVAKVADSPLPGDSRLCAYLQPA